MRFGDTKPLGAFEIQLEDLMVGACCCVRPLRMGSSDCHEAETHVHGSPVPAIAAAHTQTGGRRRTGREVAVSVRNLKAELS
jgi:hypothetical protein